MITASCRSSLVLSFLFLAAGPVGAQTITKLVAAGDLLSMGTVTSVLNVDVNNAGEWLAEVDTNNPITAEDNAVLLNGVEILREGTNFGIPPSHSNFTYFSFVDSLDINDNGDVLVAVNVRDSVTMALGTTLVLWINGTTNVRYVLMESGQTPNTGDPVQTSSPFWDNFDEVWQNNNHQLVVAGRSNTDADDMMCLVTHDGSGNLTTQTCFVIDGVVHSTQFPGSNGLHPTLVSTLGFNKTDFAINDLGQKLFLVDDDHTMPGGSTATDAHYYLDLAELVWEGSVAPTGFAYDGLMAVECDLNDSGMWAMVTQDVNPSQSNDDFVLRNGAVVALEGQPAFHDPSVNYRSAFPGPISLSDTGDLVYGVTTTAPAGSDDAVYCTNLSGVTTVLFREGVTMIGGNPVTIVSTGNDDRAVSDDGSHVVQVLSTVAGEGAYLLVKNDFESFCTGDGGNQMGCTDCPCGNNAPFPTSGGCFNAAARSARLVATGSPQVSTLADTLHFDMTGGNSSTFAVLVSGANKLPNAGACPPGSGIAAPTLDGLRCVGGAVQRHGSRSLNAIGNTTNGWGPPANPSAGLGVTAGFVAGQVRHFQVFYRENPALGCTTGQNTSNAVRVMFL